MLMVLENYPKDGILASIAMVVVAISLTTTLALLIARLFETRPTVRHGVLASALVCSLATPVIALLLRTSGTSTFAWNLLPPAQRDEPARDSAPPPPPLVQRLTPRFTEEGAPESAPATTADAPAVAEIDGLDAIGQPRAALSDLPQQSVDWQTVLRTGLSLAVTVWAIGSIAMFVRIVCGSIQVHRIRRGGRQFLVDSRGTIASHLRRYLGTED
ncbi:MAG TPA: hypothetical protein VMF30_17865, partial [Pirellulales bacterium]|nr:hypothetical protein [Pirellulales bacterium]